MKKIILMTIMISTILISCGGSGGTSNDGNQKKNIIKYKLEKTNGLTNKEVYLIESFTDLEDSNYYDLNVTGKSTSILTGKSMEHNKNKEGIKFVDIGSKFREDSPKLEKKVGNSDTINKSINSLNYVVDNTRTFITYVTEIVGNQIYDTEKPITATLKVQKTGKFNERTVKFNIWLENGSTVDINDLNELMDKFYNSSSTSDSIYTNLINLYGNEWGSHTYSNLIAGSNTSGTIDIVLTPLNKSYHSSNGYVGGYFSSDDTYLKTSKSWSNEGNIFYIDSELFPSNKTEMFSTLAHEFTHMLMWYQKTIKNKGISPSNWLNEMMAMISEDLIDNKISSTGSKTRIDEFIDEYNNVPIVDQDNSFTLENYAVDGVFGLYLTRAYRDLNVLKKIMTNSGTGYDSIESATGDNFIDIQKRFGKALMLSNIDSSSYDNRLRMNSSFNLTSNGYTYNFEPINIFSGYGSFNYDLATIQGSSNMYIKLKGLTGDSGNWTFEAPETSNLGFQVIVKNSDGSYDKTLSDELTNSIQKQ